jgi:hypothetical protein
MTIFAVVVSVTQWFFRWVWCVGADLEVLCGLEVSFNGVVVVVGGAEVVVGCWCCGEVVHLTNKVLKI